MPHMLKHACSSSLALLALLVVLASLTQAVDVHTIRRLARARLGQQQQQGALIETHVAPEYDPKTALPHAHLRPDPADENRWCRTLDNAELRACVFKKPEGEEAQRSCDVLLNTWFWQCTEPTSLDANKQV